MNLVLEDILIDINQFGIPGTIEHPKQQFVTMNKHDEYKQIMERQVVFTFTSDHEAGLRFLRSQVTGIKELCYPYDDFDAAKMVLTSLLNRLNINYKINHHIDNLKGVKSSHYYIVGLIY